MKYNRLNDIRRAVKSNQKYGPVVESYSWFSTEEMAYVLEICDAALDACIYAKKEGKLRGFTFLDAKLSSAISKATGK